MASIKKITTNSGPRWLVKYRDLNEIQKQKTFRDIRSAKEFKLAVEHKKSRIRAGMEEPLQMNLRFDEMVDAYLVLIDGQKKDKTVARERTVFKTLRTFIPNERIRNITPTMLRQYVQYRIDNGIKPATVNSELRTLKAFFNILIAHEYVQVNPVLSVKMLTVELDEPRSLSDQEIKNLLETINDPNYKDLVLMYLHSGARRSELLAPNFSWDDVDLKQRQIIVHGKFDKDRVIPLDDQAYQILRRRRYIEKHAYPFSMDYHYMYKKIKKYFVDAKIPDGTVHALRRTFGSKLVQQGVDIYIVSKLLGHSSIKVTESHYIHILHSNLQNGIKALDHAW